MTYPGDPSLPPDVQHRILTTYRQTLQLASQGSRQEALLGCDFVLRLDSQFGPARVLQQMIHGGSPPQAFQDLLASAPQTPPQAAAPARAEFGELAGLSLGVPGSAGAATPTSPADLARRLTELVEARQFAPALALAESERRAVAADPRLRELVEQAQVRLEAEPYVLTFLESARQARAVGETDEAERLLRKARSLDPTHPGLAEFEPGRERPAARETTFASGSFADLAETAGGGEADLELPELDFSLPSELPSGFDLEDVAAPAPEGEGRIAELLREGQAAFDRGEHQSAIDSWSRIFLIDIDHQEAARRIEQARQLKAEREREVEEIFHDAVARFDSGDSAGAEAEFRRVLELQPGYVLAQEYLEKLAERAAGGAAAAPPRTLPPIEPPAPASPGFGAPAPARAATVARDQLSEEILVPPDPGMAAAPPRRAAAGRAAAPRVAQRSSAPTGRFLLIGGAVLALLAGGGWFVASRWSQLFPNAKAGPATPVPQAVSPVERAQQLHAEGKTAIAIAQLRRLAPQDPHYSEAQSLVSQWEALLRESEKPQLAPALAQRRRELIEGAGRALASGENARARSQLEQAAQIAPLDADAAELAVTARERLAPFAEELRLLQQGDYEFALSLLWRRRENEKDNRDLDRLIVDSYYNLGVLDLQRNDPQAARERFAEARKLDAADPVLERLDRFAATYAGREEDLLYRILVKYLPVR